MKKLMQIFPALVLPCCFIAQPGATLDFDGVNDQVTLTHFSRPPVMTIEAFIRTSTLLDAQIVGWAGNTGNSAEFKVSGGKVYYFEWDNSNWIGVGSLSTVNDGQWHHVAVARSTAAVSNVTVFVDGFMENTGYVNLPITTNALNIGAYDYSGLAQFFEGSIDEVRIWNRVLCDGEIQMHTGCELSASEVGLLRYYRFNQGIGSASNSTVTQLTDASPNLSHGVLGGFLLSGTGSNWISPGAVTSGMICPPFSNGLSVNSATVCRGSQVTLSVTGTAYGYTWMPSGQTGSSLSVSPQVTSVFTVNADVGIGCTSFLTSTVTPSGPMIQVTGPATVCAGAMITLTASGAGSYSWSTGGTGQVLNITAGTSTSYVATGTLNGCSSSKSFIVQTSPCTGIDENKADSGLPAIRPNPASGILYIGEITADELDVFDVSGKLYRRVSVNPAQEVDISSFATGLYFFRFPDGRCVKVVKADGFY